jgi:hypothetical protein
MPLEGCGDFIRIIVKDSECDLTEYVYLGMTEEETIVEGDSSVTYPPKYKWFSKYEIQQDMERLLVFTSQHDVDKAMSYLIMRNEVTDSTQVLKYCCDYYDGLPSDGNPNCTGETI